MIDYTWRFVCYAKAMPCSLVVVAEKLGGRCAGVLLDSSGSEMDGGMALDGRCVGRGSPILAVMERYGAWDRGRCGMPLARDGWTLDLGMAGGSAAEGAIDLGKGGGLVSSWKREEDGWPNMQMQIAAQAMVKGLMNADLPPRQAAVGGRRLDLGYLVVDRVEETMGFRQGDVWAAGLHGVDGCLPMDGGKPKMGKMGGRSHGRWWQGVEEDAIFGFWIFMSWLSCCLRMMMGSSSACLPRDFGWLGSAVRITILVLRRSTENHVPTMCNLQFRP
ncbi:hypothetical protein ACLOJK_034737 [Asimina triloba]